jgi:signal transduction histidine kinase
MIMAALDPTVLGIAAAVSTLIGAVLAVASYIANRRTAAEKANEEQHKELLECREEAERLSRELYEQRRVNRGE